LRAYRGSGGIIPLLDDVEWLASWPNCSFPREGATVPIEWETGWATELL